MIELKQEPSVNLFELMVRWLYSASVEIPSSIFEVTQLFFIAHNFQILDLMSRCEHEIINKIDSVNVVDLLVLLQPASLPENQATARAQKAIAQQIILKSQQLLHELDPDYEVVA